MPKRIPGCYNCGQSLQHGKHYDIIEKEGKYSARKQKIVKRLCEKCYNILQKIDLMKLYVKELDK